MSGIDPYDWEGDVTAENREQVKEALQGRMPTRHIAISKHELFSVDCLTEGDHVVFGLKNVVVILVYGKKKKEYKMVIVK